METNIIKNLTPLLDIPAAAIEKLEYGAMLHRRYSRITFKIKEADPEKVVIQVAQGKSPAENYATIKRLIEVTHELFDQFLPDKKIQVQPIPYEENPASVVTPGWIREMMGENGTRLKDIVKESGLDTTNLSAVINGTRPLTQPLKAFFFYYFAHKSVVRASRHGGR